MWVNPDRFVSLTQILGLKLLIRLMKKLFPVHQVKKRISCGTNSTFNVIIPVWWYDVICCWFWPNSLEKPLRKDSPLIYPKHFPTLLSFCFGQFILSRSHCFCICALCLNGFASYILFDHSSSTNSDASNKRRHRRW